MRDDNLIPHCQDVHNDVVRALKYDEEPKVIHFHNWKEYIKDFRITVYMDPMVTIWRKAKINFDTIAPGLFDDLESGSVTTYRNTKNYVEPTIYIDKSLQINMDDLEQLKHLKKSKTKFCQTDLALGNGTGSASNELKGYAMELLSRRCFLKEQHLVGSQEDDVP